MLDAIAQGLTFVIGLPIALFVGVAARESFRSFVALVLGFRVFEIRLGVGLPLIARTLGPVDTSLARWPIGGRTLALSGAPRFHRLSRATLAIAPILPQLVWMLGRTFADASSGIVDGPAVNFLTVLDLANGVLLAVHTLLPSKLPEGTHTDLRLLIDAFLGHPDSDRSARADYYARLTINHLERGQIDRARRSLTLGLRQLGPVALLTEFQHHLESRPLESIVEQSECAAVLRQCAADAESRGRHEGGSDSLRRRLKQLAAGVVPMTIALAGLGTIQANRIADGIEAGLIAKSEKTASSGDRTACRELVDTWMGWVRIDPRDTLAHTARRDRAQLLALLESCRGRSQDAAAARGEAILAANAARGDLAEDLARTPESWFDNELRLTELLVLEANQSLLSGQRRLTLVTIGQAERHLESVEDRLLILSNHEAKQQIEARFERLRETLAELRTSVLGRD